MLRQLIRYVFLTCLGIGYLCNAAELLLPLMSNNYNGNIYYVDANNGDDSYSGRLAERDPNNTDGPLRSIQTAYDKLQPGDCLYIKKGIYRETLTLYKQAFASRTIVIRPFPNDEGEVVINAAEEIDGWQRCANQTLCANNPNWQHIFYADIDFEVKELFQNGFRLRPSRYPDIGWLFPTSVDHNKPKTIFHDSHLTEESDYLWGGICNVKTAMWHLDQIPVISVSASDGKVTLESPARYDISPSFGYYFTHIVGEINEEGEWAYDSAQKRIYLWPVKASLDNIESGFRHYGIDTHAGCSYHIVEGLVIKYAVDDGIRLYKTDHITIKENTVDYSFSAGIEEYEGSNSTLLSNDVRYSNRRGITDRSLSTYHTVIGNTVYATGAENVGDDLINGVGEGIFIGGRYAKVVNNRVDRSGYTGIFLSGDTSGREITYNYITNSCLSLSDGGGIYTGGHSDSTEQDYFHHNIISDIWGYVGGVSKYKDVCCSDLAFCRGGAYGIYLDEQGNNRMFEYNTVVNGGDAGIFFHWARGNLLAHNTLYGNVEYQIIFSGKNDPKFILQHNDLQNNLLIATNMEQKTFQLNVNYDDINFGNSDGNYFYNPVNGKHIYVCKSFNELNCTSYTLEEWQRLSGQDLHSKDLSSLAIQDDGQQLPIILINPSMSNNTIDLAGQVYMDIEGDILHDKITLGPFESVVLFRTDGS